MSSQPSESSIPLARCRLLTRLLTARSALDAALGDCGELCEATPHETDLQYRAADVRLRRMREMAIEVEGILRHGEVE